MILQKELNENKEIQERTEVYLKIYEKYFSEVHNVEVHRPVVQMPSGKI